MHMNHHEACMSLDPWAGIVKRANQLPAPSPIKKGKRIYAVRPPKPRRYVITKKQWEAR
jgi:hypothetical protein